MVPVSPPLDEPRPTLLEAPRRWTRNLATAFFTAVQFLTIVPTVLRRLPTPQEMGRSVGFFPLSGLLLGYLLLGVGECAAWYWSPGIGTGLVLLVWVLTTGALHLDGLLDSCDGLLGGRTSEDRL